MTPLCAAVLADPITPLAVRNAATANRAELHTGLLRMIPWSILLAFLVKALPAIAVVLEWLMSVHSFALAVPGPRPTDCPPAVTDAITEYGA